MGDAVPCGPAVCPDAVDSIDALTLPVVTHPRRALPPAVTTVDELTLPFRAHVHPAQHTQNPSAGVPPQRWLWMFGHALLLVGAVVLATVGGVWASAQAQIDAARGDVETTVRASIPTHPAGSPVRRGRPTEPPAIAPGSPQPRVPIPILNSSSAMDQSTPVAVTMEERSTITRLVIPAIALDRKVVEVGWSTEEIDGQDVAVWEVDRYRVGHHHGSSNPGGGSNIVLTGHSGGNAYPFNELFYLKPGDLIEVTSAGQLYQYTVTEQQLVDEVGQPLATRLQNARFMEPTDTEVITMIACWPLTGPTKFSQRVIVRAQPIPVPSMTQDLSPIHPR
jgi:sortase A